MQSERLRDNIVVVKVNGKDIYLDPGAALVPFGMLPWSETQAPGIRLDNQGGTWIRTPLPGSAESQMRRVANLRLLEAGDLEGTLTVSFTGLEALRWRVGLRNADEVARKKSLEEHVKALIPASAEAELTKKPDWSNSEMPFVAEFAVKVPGWASGSGRRLLVPVGVFAASEKHIFEHSERIHPVYFAYPYGDLDDVTIELPAQWQAVAVPKARTRNGDNTAYSLKVEDNRRTLQITRQLNVDIFILEKDRYSILRNFFQAVRAGDEEQIIVESGPGGASQ